MSVVSAISPVRCPLRLIRMEGDDVMKMFGLMEMTIGGKPQRVPGSMDRIAAPEGVKMHSLDVWNPGEAVEMKLQHVISTGTTRSYYRYGDDADRLAGFRRFRAVLVAQTPDRGYDDMDIDIPDAESDAAVKRPVVEDVVEISQELFNALPFDFAAKVKVR
jgi:hypothetical protein